VIVSGRPLVLGDAAAQADAIVAAWLPGSEGSGVADVLFGDAKPTGKLSFTLAAAVSLRPRLDVLTPARERRALSSP
jgi:beta-glucosidase